MPDPRYTAVSLYSGAGGLDRGFIEAGFEIQWAVDSDRWAVATYEANIGSHIELGELPDTHPREGLSPAVVIGGPPCQGFSVIGRMDPSDPRSAHVFTFLDIVGQLSPRAFVMENVKALASAPRWSDVRSALLERARGLGYQVELLLLNAADYGVPQARERMFMVGIASEKRPEHPLQVTPPWPVPTSRGNPPTVGETLRKLPKFGSPGNDARSAARVVPARDPVMRPSPYRGSLLFNGSGRPLYLDGPAKTLPASMGGNATPIVDQRELDHGAPPWVVEYHAHLAANGRPYDEAPDHIRRITVQEAAALQTFPPGWRFAGPRNAQYRQVGNAVPPRLAQAVAAALRQALEFLDSQAQQQSAPDGQRMPVYASEAPLIGDQAA